jgi:hypothetical protein
VSHRREREHPEWCHVARCHAVSLGEHRSEPVVVGVGGAGGIVATRVRTRRGVDRLELRVSASLGAGADVDQAAAARRVLAELVDALNRAASSGRTG